MKRKKSTITIFILIVLVIISIGGYIGYQIYLDNLTKYKEVPIPKGSRYEMDCGFMQYRFTSKLSSEELEKYYDDYFDEAEKTVKKPSYADKDDKYIYYNTGDTEYRLLIKSDNEFFIIGIVI